MGEWDALVHDDEPLMFPRSDLDESEWRSCVGIHSVGAGNVMMASDADDHHDVVVEREAPQHHHPILEERERSYMMIIIS